MQNTPNGGGFLADKEELIVKLDAATSEAVAKKDNSAHPLWIYTLSMVTKSDKYQELRKTIGEKPDSIAWLEDHLRPLAKTVTITLDTTDPKKAATKPVLKRKPDLRIIEPSKSPDAPNKWVATLTLGSYEASALGDTKEIKIPADKYDYTFAPATPEKAAAAPPPKPEKQKPATQASTDNSWKQWLIVGIGGAVGLGSGSFWYLTDDTARRYQHDVNIGKSTFNSSKKSTLENETTIAVAGVGVGVAAIGAGLGWFIWDATHPAKSQAMEENRIFEGVAFAPTSNGGAGLVFSFSIK